MAPGMDPLPSQSKRMPVYLIGLVAVGVVLAILGLLVLRTRPSADTVLQSNATSPKRLVLYLASAYAQNGDVQAALNALKDWDTQALADLFAQVEVSAGEPLQRKQVASLRRALDLPAPTHHPPLGAGPDAGDRGEFGGAAAGVGCLCRQHPAGSRT